MGSFRHMYVALYKGPSVRGLRADGGLHAKQSPSLLPSHTACAACVPPSLVMGTTRAFPRNQTHSLACKAEDLSSPLRATFKNIHHVHKTARATRAILSKAILRAKSKEETFLQQEARCTSCVFKSLLSCPPFKLGNAQCLCPQVRLWNVVKAQGLLTVQGWGAVLVFWFESVSYILVTLLAYIQNTGNY